MKNQQSDQHIRVRELIKQAQGGFDLGALPEPVVNALIGGLIGLGGGGLLGGISGDIGLWSAIGALGGAGLGGLLGGYDYITGNPAEEKRMKIRKQLGLPTSAAGAAAPGLVGTLLGARAAREGLRFATWASYLGRPFEKRLMMALRSPEAADALARDLTLMRNRLIRYLNTAGAQMQRGGSLQFPSGQPVDPKVREAANRARDALRSVNELLNDLRGISRGFNRDPSGRITARPAATRSLVHSMLSRAESIRRNLAEFEKISPIPPNESQPFRIQVERSLLEDPRRSRLIERRLPSWRRILLGTPEEEAPMMLGRFGSGTSRFQSRLGHAGSIGGQLLSLVLGSLAAYAAARGTGSLIDYLRGTDEAPYAKQKELAEALVE